MAKRSIEPPTIAAAEPVIVGDEVPAGDAPTSAPSITLGDPAAPPPAVDEERFRVETAVYYVPHLGFGAVFVPAGTIVTRSSHDLQKLIVQGAKLRPVT